MLLKDQAAFGNIINYISTTEPRPTEDPDQPQKSLGEIAYSEFDQKKNYQFAPKEEKARWEKAALYLLEQTLEKMTMTHSTYKEYALGSHLYVALTPKNYFDWKELPANTYSTYDHPARQVIKAVLIRAMTLQKKLMDYLYENPAYIDEDSLGQIAFATRFPKSPLKPRPNWEDAAQFLLYVWHQKITKALKGFDNHLSWGAHLYVGIATCRNGGYEAWADEDTQLKEDYEIASVRVFNSTLLRAISAQQQQVAGQPSPESLFPA